MLLPQKLSACLTIVQLFLLRITCLITSVCLVWPSASRPELSSSTFFRRDRKSAVLQSCPARAVDSGSRHAWSYHLLQSAPVMTAVPCMKHGCPTLFLWLISGKTPNLVTLAVKIAATFRESFLQLSRVDRLHQRNATFLLQQRATLFFADVLQVVTSVLRFTVCRSYGELIRVANEVGAPYIAQGAT